MVPTFCTTCRSARFVFQCPATGRGDGRRHLWSLVADIGEDGLDEGERPARCAKQLTGAVAVLHVAGMDDDAPSIADKLIEDNVKKGWALAEPT